VNRRIIDHGGSFTHTIGGKCQTLIPETALSNRGAPSGRQSLVEPTAHELLYVQHSLLMHGDAMSRTKHGSCKAATLEVTSRSS